MFFFRLKRNREGTKNKLYIMRQLYSLFLLIKDEIEDFMFRRLFSKLQDFIGRVKSNSMNYTRSKLIMLVQRFSQSLLTKSRN